VRRVKAIAIARGSKESRQQIDIAGGIWLCIWTGSYFG